MKSLLALVFTLVTFSFAKAQSSVTASASAIIVTPIVVSKQSDLNFGNISIGSASGTVTLQPSNSRLASNGAVLPSTSGTVSVASFKISGEQTYSYTITLPQSVLLSRQSGRETMVVDGFQSLPAGTGTLSTAGTQDLTVGATLHVNGQQAPGLYNSLTPFEVLVNYN